MVRGSGIASRKNVHKQGVAVQLGIDADGAAVVETSVDFGIGGGGQGGPQGAQVGHGIAHMGVTGDSVHVQIGLGGRTDAGWIEVAVANGDAGDHIPVGVGCCGIGRVLRDTPRKINMRTDGAIICDRYNDAIPIKATTAYHKVINGVTPMQTAGFPILGFSGLASRFNELNSRVLQEGWQKIGCQSQGDTVLPLG